MGQVFPMQKAVTGGIGERSIAVKEQAERILKVGCILMIVGGILTTILTLAGTLRSYDSMVDLDAGTYQNVESQMRDVTEGLMGADAAIGILTGIIGVIVAVYVAMLVIDLVVGFMGLRRSRQPEKNRFFLVWGIVLLIIGVLGFLFSGGLTLRGIAALVCGVVAPILFLVGAGQQRKALLVSQSSPW